jgi:serine/tyrosine/threonine adenylyltransferase
MNAPIAPNLAAPDPAASQLDPLGRLALENSLARLPEAFYTRLLPDGLPAPHLVAASDSAARLIGLDAADLRRQDSIETFAGNRPLPGAEPLAAVYAGHQFGVWAGRLGDGRALLLGEAVGPDGRRWEMQLKGSGKTPYSRMGDGRAVLRSSIREFLCSEAMFHLGIPTSRALIVVGADLPVIRESIESAAIVTRMAPSFVRFGSFEHFYSGQRTAELKTLADYVIGKFYPHLLQISADATPSAPNRYAGLLREVSIRTGRLIAQWQAVGFCHGVMNTDNMSILGLTIDYGPFGFIDGFDANHICNHSDDAGRYAYSMQPQIGEWNCFCLGQALIPLIDSVEHAQAALASYREAFDAEWAARMHAKLGLVDTVDGDPALISRVFEILHRGRVDFTRFFRSLSRVRAGDDSGDAGCRDLFIDRAAFDSWAGGYRARLSRQSRPDPERAAAMNRVNPKYVLRNHLAEVAISKARGTNEMARLTRIRAGDANAQPTIDDRDFSEVARLLDVLSRPFDEQPEFEAYAALPPEWSKGLEVSCSS